VTTTTEPQPPTVAIDGQPVPLDDCIWLERRPCGCTVAAVIAVVPDAWSIATAEEAFRHFNPTERDRERAIGRTAEPVTGARYREEFSSHWHCEQHAPAPATPSDAPRA
jgi:hypothetical protein